MGAFFGEEVIDVPRAVHLPCTRAGLPPQLDVHLRFDRSVAVGPRDPQGPLPPCAGQEGQADALFASRSKPVLFKISLPGTARWNWRILTASSRSRTLSFRRIW